MTMTIACSTVIYPAQLLHTLQGVTWQTVILLNYFLNNFYFDYLIVNKFVEIIGKFIVIVYAKN